MLAMTRLGFLLFKGLRSLPEKKTHTINAFKKIVLPLDSTKITRQKLPITALLAKYFNSEVHILGILTTTSDDIRYRVKNYVSQAEEYFAENDIKYISKTIEADNITDIMDGFSIYRAMVPGFFKTVKVSPAMPAVDAVVHEMGLLKALGL